MNKGDQRSPNSTTSWKLLRKRGLSPVIATVLLISIALILAIIIFLWARSFIGEQIIKLGEPVENACDDVSFNAQVFEGSLDIVNEGNIALYGIEVRKKDLGTIADADNFEGNAVDIGESGTISGLSLSRGDQVILVPILLGESGEVRVPYVCDEEFGLIRVVEVEPI